MVYEYSTLDYKNKKLVDDVRIYLGFNEVLSEDKYHSLIFKKCATNLDFSFILGMLLKAVLCNYLSSLGTVYNHPYYDFYRKKLQADFSKIQEMITVGGSAELDPYGQLRAFVKKKYGS